MGRPGAAKLLEVNRFLEALEDVDDRGVGQAQRSALKRSAMRVSHDLYERTW